MALERFFEDLSNGHEFFIDQAFGLAEISKTSCPVFFFAIVSHYSQICVNGRQTYRQIELRTNRENK